MNEAAQILDQSTVSTSNTQTNDQKTPDSQGAPASAQVSPKLEIIIKREQALRQQAESLKAKESEIQTALQRIKDFDEAKGGNSKKALELLGLNYDQLTQSLLKDGEIPPDVEIKKVRDELEEFKRRQQLEKDKEAEEVKRQASLQEQKMITDFKSEIATYIKDNAARYELTAFEQADDLVFGVIDEHYSRTLDAETGIGKVMPIAEACDKVEAHFEKKEQDRKKLSKLQTIWKAMPQSLARELIKPDQQRVQPPKTLTNTMAASTSKPNPRPNEEQRVAQIVAQFRAQKGF